MFYKARILKIKNQAEAIEEFMRIGATTAGSNIMAGKIFPLAIKVKKISPIAANIIKQEMLARDGDTVTSRNSLVEKDKKTDVIILGNLKSIKDLVNKLKMQQFGLKELAADICEVINRYPAGSKNKEILKIGNKEFDLRKNALVMGILNVTPDSFYDGGNYFEKEKAFKRVKEIAEEGAEIIDIGGMSTRPGSLPVEIGQELERTIPVIEYVKNNYDISISIDTCRAEVAEEALKAGAHLVNDISGLLMDKNMAEVISRNNASAVIMHIKGTPENMQKDPVYENIIDEVYEFLAERACFAVSKSIDPERIILDPGIGFGKTLEYNLKLISKIEEFKMLGFPVLVGLSRKSFIGGILDLPLEERLEGSLAAAVWCISNGAGMIRVHDVKETVRAVRVVKAVLGAC